MSVLPGLRPTPIRAPPRPRVNGQPSTGASFPESMAIPAGIEAAPAGVDRGVSRTDRGVEPEATSATSLPNPAMSGALTIPGRNEPSPRASLAADLARAVASLAAVGDVAGARIAA